MAVRIVPRALDLSDALKHRSCFLLGPRSTGKSTLIHETLPDALVFNLLSNEVFLALFTTPSLLERAIKPDTEIVVIDEIQKAPQLLDEVHRLIETRKIRFLLTGSSARKLRRGGVNLLGGRAGTIRFHPLLVRELADDFNLQRALRYGTMPSAYLSEEPRRFLRDYVGTYLREEIAAEGLTRNLPSFSRCLNLAAHCNARIVNFSNLASDAQVPRTTVHDFFDILMDTLLIHELPTWRESGKRKPASRSKYYFFDVGIATAIQSQDFIGSEGGNGHAFETWLFHELNSWIDYCERDETLRYWRSQSGFEVEFLLGDHTAIAVKSKRHLGGRDFRSLRALQEEKKFRNYLCVCLEPFPWISEDEIEVLPYTKFLDNLWDGAYSG